MACAGRARPPFQKISQLPTFRGIIALLESADKKRRPSMPVDTHKPAFDRDAAMARVGGDTELLKELAELFEDEWPRSLTLLRDALRRQDSIAVQNAAHGLK